jgi:hypothetical protein
MEESLVAIQDKPEDILKYVQKGRGLLWDKISDFQNQISEMDGGAKHQLGQVQEKDMQLHYPLEHNLEGGLYTREVFMPQGHVLVSFIHKQKHPSFLLQGKVSYLNDTGEIKTISAPKKIFTQIGAQRIFYVHEDTRWVCVYKTDAKTVEEAEREVYTDDYKTLPENIINKVKKLWQE